jgi:ectoine hydroxylase-related dioxygenase (phytanoyl-CoA dioxygenase family)
MMLDERQVQDYRRQGFACVPDFVSAEDLAAFRGEIDRITAASAASAFDPARVEMEPNQGASGRVIRRIYEPCEHYAPFREYSESAAILDAVQQLIGDNLLLHYSKLNMKPAEIGSVVEWHQDLSYYPLTNHDSLAVLIYLDDADETNGCLRVLPGRHRADLMDHTASGVFQGCITEPVDETAAVNLAGGGGTAIFLDAMTPHASTQNRSGRQRRTLIISYRAADAFPLHIDNRTAATEAYTRLVRGTRPHQARFTFSRFPIPIYGAKEASLYQLQELSRRNRSAGAGS